VVFVDEHTASDWKGISQGILEWDSANWWASALGEAVSLPSDHQLVDGRIITAPEFFNTNEEFIDMVTLDVEVDNNPHMSITGKISPGMWHFAELMLLLEEEPVVIPKILPRRPHMSKLHGIYPA